MTAKKQLDEAAKILRRALALKPDFAQAWYNLGNVLRDQGNFTEAVDAYRQAVKLRVDYVEAHINLGNALQTLGEFKESADAYLIALSVKPDCVDAYTNVGAALQKMGHIDQAIDILRQGFGTGPDFNIAHCNIGNLYKDCGRVTEAIASYQAPSNARRPTPSHTAIWPTSSISIRIMMARRFCGKICGSTSCTPASSVTKSRRIRTTRRRTAIADRLRLAGFPGALPVAIYDAAAVEPGSRAG